jgi:hypothetical protein
MGAINSCSYAKWELQSSFLKLLLGIEHRFLRGFTLELSCSLRISVMHSGKSLRKAVRILKHFELGKIRIID